MTAFDDFQIKFITPQKPVVLPISSKIRQFFSEKVGSPERTLESEEWRRSDRPTDWRRAWYLDHYDRRDGPRERWLVTDPSMQGVHGGLTTEVVELLLLDVDETGHEEVSTRDTDTSSSLYTHTADVAESHPVFCASPTTLRNVICCLFFSLPPSSIIYSLHWLTRASPRWPSLCRVER